jgi:cell division septal protein FtsQ
MTNIPANIPMKEPVHRKRWGIWLCIPLCAGIIVLFIFAMEWRESLKIQRVVVEGASLMPVKEILALTKIQPKSSLVNVNLFDVRRKLLQQPMIKNAGVNRIYPGTVAITIEERIPIALLNCGQMRFVDEEGVVLPYLSSASIVDLPMISNIEGVQNAEAGKVLRHKDLAEAIEILQTAQLVDTAIYHFISEIDMQQGKGVALYTTEAGVQIILGHGDVAKKMIMLQNFWNSFVKTSDIDMVKSIDLRFEDQVVVQWNRKPESDSRRALL